jgi:hypothetical protein
MKKKQRSTIDVPFSIWKFGNLCDDAAATMAHKK